jgi:hypothetical protein
LHHAIAIFQEIGEQPSTFKKAQEPSMAAACWREAASAMRDAGDQDEAARFDVKAAECQSG